MALPTFICGAILVAIGMGGYLQQETGRESPTALIPAAIGAVLMLCGLLAFNEKFRKHAMHLAAMVGLVGFLGGFMPLVSQVKKTGTLDPTKASAVSAVLMILICAGFVGMCVNSFIRAKKARKAAAGSGA